MISVLLNWIKSSDDPLGVDGGKSFGAWKAETSKECNHSDTVTAGNVAWICNTLVLSIALIPSLMKTVLLQSNHDPVKLRVFLLSIVRHVISSQHSIGNWLVSMWQLVLVTQQIPYPPSIVDATSFSRATKQKHVDRCIESTSIPPNAGFTLVSMSTDIDPTILASGEFISAVVGVVVFFTGLHILLRGTSA